MIHPIPIPQGGLLNKPEDVAGAVRQILQILSAMPRFEMKDISPVCVAGASVTVATSFKKVYGVQLLRCRRTRDTTESVTFNSPLQWRHDTRGVTINLDPGDSTELQHEMTIVVWGE